MVYTKDIDMIVIGAGTAGLSAAIYAVRGGLSCIVAESIIHGGQIINTPDIENYPAIPRISGYEFAENLYKQAVDLGAQVVYASLEDIKQDGAYFLVQAGGETYQAKTVVIANGAKHRKLGVEGEERFSGRGVSYCATCDGAFYRGLDTVVVGGGNTALEDALFLANNCKTVSLIHRRDSFRAHKKTVDMVLSKKNIIPVYDSVVEEIRGGTKVNAIAVKNVKTGEQKEIPTDGVFVAVGLEPDNSRFAHLIALDSSGYIQAGEDCKTSCPGIFAAGDTRTKPLRQLVTAAADGAVAATQAAVYINETF